jgi:hypothetical protein
MPKRFEIEPIIMKVIYRERFEGRPGEDPIALKSLKKDVNVLDSIMSTAREFKLRCFPICSVKKLWIGS